MSVVTMEKIDEIRERIDVTYQEAKDALEKCDGDVLEAIIYLENRTTKFKEFSNKSAEYKKTFMDSIKDLIDEGNVTKIVIKKNNQVILNIPVTVGVVSAVFFTGPITVSIIAAFVSGCTVYIEKEDGEVVNMNEKATETFYKSKEKATETFNKSKEKATDFYQDTKKKYEDFRKNEDVAYPEFDEEEEIIEEETEVEE